MAVINEQMDAAAELGRNPVSKHQIQPEHGEEQADAGRDCRTRLARQKSQARARTGKYSGLSSVTIFHLGNVCRGKQPPRYCTVIGGW